jgi:hypothetical protein
MKVNKKISLQQFLPLSEVEIQGLLHLAQANLRYFLARGFSLFSCPQHSLEVLLLLNPMCLLNFSFFIFWFRLTVTRLPRVYCNYIVKCFLRSQFLEVYDIFRKYS